MNDEIELTGKDLNIGDFVKVVKENKKVKIADKAYEKLENSREYVLNNLNTDKPIYGMNRGVGENKDQVVFSEYYEKYNRNLIYAHCVAVKPEADIEEVRAALLARLNTLLMARTGIQPSIVEMYRDFLNYGIHPVIPKRGSVGEGDIACLSHIGLAMLGEGEVYFKGKKINAQKALDKVDLKPVNLGPKDGLAIVSSNALSAGKAALIVDKIEELVKKADLVYSLSLEGIKGNVSPLDKRVKKFRPYSGQKTSIERVTDYLEGSFIWQKGIAEHLQDPVSFRSACHIHGAVLDSLNYAKKQLEVQLNSSDDNPCVLYENDDIVSTGNFEPLSWVLGFEMVANGLSHLSRISTSRIKHLSDPETTGLNRFLTPKMGDTIAFGTIQKPFSALDAEIRDLANPSSVDYNELAGDIEDHGTNAPYIMQKLEKIIDNVYYILGIEVMHSAQAVELRGVKEAISDKTCKLFKSFRKEVPFLDKDRPLSPDIEKAKEVIENY